MHWSLNHDACMRPTNPQLEARIRERSNCVIDGQCQLWSSDRMFHNYHTILQPTAEIEMQFWPNVCQKCRMNGYVKRKRNECCMTEWMNEWISCAARPAGAFTPTNTPKSAVWMTREWPPCLHFQCVGFLPKAKNEIREKEKFALQ